MSHLAPAARQIVRAVLWIDHDEARVLHFNGIHHKATIHAERRPARKVEQHHFQYGARSMSVAAASGSDQTYLGHVAAALADAEEILVVGPGRAKSDFIAFLRTHHPERAARVAAVETGGSPNDGQLVAHARAYFRHAQADRRDPSLPALRPAGSSSPA